MMEKTVKLRTEIEKFVQLTDNEWGMLEPFIEIRQLKKHTLFSEAGKKSSEIGFVLEAKNKEDIQSHIEHFNMFCQQFDWCDKESLIIIDGEYGNDICWDAFEEDHGNIISAATEFDIDGNKIYITIKLH